MSEKFRDYANLTETQRERIIKEYRYARSMNCPPYQSISIAASNGLRLTSRQRQGKTGGNAFAAACAVLITAKVIDTRRSIEGVIE